MVGNRAVMYAARLFCHADTTGETWLQRQGEYEIINAGDDYLLVKGIRLRSEAGLLVMEYAMPLFAKGTMSVAIRPINNTEALIFGMGRGMGETIRFVSVNGENLLQFSGYLLRKNQKKNEGR